MENILQQSYSDFINQFPVYSSFYRAQARGFEAHHIIPKAVQKRKYGKVYDDRCVRLTTEEHLRAHYLYCKTYPEDKEEFIALDLMLSARAKKLLKDEEIFFKELPQLAEMRDEGKKVRSASLKGRTLSQEQKKKLSEAHKGRAVSTETREKLSRANKGKKQTEEQRRANSERQKGERSSWWGRHHTEEEKKKISLANKGRHLTDEHKAHLSESRKGKYTGKDNPHAKKVYMYSLSGELIATFSTCQEVVEQIGINPGYLSHLLKGEKQGKPKKYPYIFTLEQPVPQS